MQHCWFQVSSSRRVGSQICHTKARIWKCAAKTDHFMPDLLIVSEGFETEINDLNTFTTRVEKLGTDVGSESDGLLPPLWLKADT